MKNNFEYTKAPNDIENALAKGRIVEDFLPPPSQLVKKVKKEKITILLRKESVDFFKRVAKSEGVPYQVMIDNLLDSYVKHYGT
jgi:predicted DNA binding CopG/RHH family protein